MHEQRMRIRAILTRRRLLAPRMCRTRAGQSTASAYNETVAVFSDFLDAHWRDLDVGTTLSLLSTHGRTEEMMHYARLLGDFDRVVQHYVQAQDWKGGACRVGTRVAASFNSPHPLCVVSV